MGLQLARSVREVETEPKLLHIVYNALYFHFLLVLVCFYCCWLLSFLCLN